MGLRCLLPCLNCLLQGKDSKSQHKRLPHLPCYLFPFFRPCSLLPVLWGILPGLRPDFPLAAGLGAGCLK